MSVASRLRRQLILREAEGYLDLLLTFDVHGETRTAVRDQVAQRCLDTLGRLGETEQQRGHAQYLRGQALRVMNRYAEAVEPLKIAAADEPSDIHIWLALGWCYKRTGRLDLAIESLEEALSVDSSQAIISYNLACYWSLAGNVRRAVDYLSRALSADPNYRNLIDQESDFDRVRNDPAFQAVTSVIV